MESFISIPPLTEKELWEGLAIAAVVTKNFKRKEKDVIRQLDKPSRSYDCPGQNKFLWRRAEVWRIHGESVSLLHQFYENVWKPTICEINSIMSVGKAFRKPEWIHQVFLCTQIAKPCPLLSSILIIVVRPTKQRSWNLWLFGWEFVI